MKTQTNQLSLLESDQVTGGSTNHNANLLPEFETSAWISGKLSPNLSITLSGRETGGRFTIMI